MSWQSCLEEAGKKRHAKTISTKRWKQESDTLVCMMLDWVVPILFAVGVFLITNSIKETLIWGGCVWFVSAFGVSQLLTEPWFIGLSNDELDQVVRNFLVSAANLSRIRMSAGKRRFALYCEVTSDDTSFIGVQLPRRHWDDVFDQAMREKLNEAGVQDIYGAQKNIYAWGPREAQFVHALLQCVLDTAEIPLEKLAVSPVHETTPVFSDEPVKSPCPREGMEKK